MNNSKELKKMRRYYARMESNSFVPYEKPEFDNYELQKIDAALSDLIEKEGYKIIGDAPNLDHLKKETSKSLSITKAITIFFIGLFVILVTSINAPIILTGGLIIGLFPISYLLGRKNIKSYVHPFLVEIEGELEEFKRNIPTASGHGLIITYFLDDVKTEWSQIDLMKDVAFNNKNERYKAVGYLVLNHWNNFELNKYDLRFYPVKIELIHTNKSSNSC